MSADPQPHVVTVPAMAHPILDALDAYGRAELDVDRAQARLDQARRNLAVAVDSRPDGKDAGFEADFKAKQIILNLVLAAWRGEQPSTDLAAASGGGEPCS